MLTPDWQRSPWSANNGNCVEARRDGSMAAVRDSKDLDGPQLRFTATEWAAFLARVRASR